MKHFSEREKQIIKIIGRKKIMLREISSELFKIGDRPFDTVITVANSVRRIVRKCEHYDLGWTLVKTRVDRKLIIKREKV